MSTETETRDMNDGGTDQKGSLNDHGPAFSPTDLLDLNDDCLIAILKELPTNLDFHSIASTCVRLEGLARNAFKSHKSRKMFDIEKMIVKYEPNEIEEIQRYLHNFGESITEIRFCLPHFSLNAIQDNKGAVRNRAIFDAIVRCCADTLEKLDLTNILMELSPLPANTYYFRNLLNFTISACYDCSLSSDNYAQLPPDLSGNCFANFLSDSLANFLKCVPNPIKLQELFIYHSNLNNDTVRAISKCVELQNFQFFYCSRIASDNVHLLSSLIKITKLILDCGRYSHDGVLILKNIGSIDSLEQLTLRSFDNDPNVFLAALKRFTNLQFVHFSTLRHFEANYFYELDNFRSVRRFSLHSWPSRCVSVKDLIAIVTVMDNLETLVVLSTVGGRDGYQIGNDDDQLTNETYMQMVNICRRSDRKLILKLPGFDDEDGFYDLDFDQEVYAANRKYIEFKELQEDDLCN